jgi:hypothetical protein
LTLIIDKGIIDNFLVYLNRKHKTWRKNTNHNVPYSTIFQSSGYGKSRLVKEVAKKIPTIYLCFQDAKSTGYPSRTSAGADLFKQVLGNLKEGEEWRFLFVLQTIIECFKKELENCNNNNEELWKKQMSKEFCERIWNEIEFRSENWRRVYREDTSISTDTFIVDDNTADNVRFLFCIDEARTLLSPIDNKISSFRLLRRSLRQIK